MASPLQMYFLEQLKADREMRAVLRQAALSAAARIDEASERGVGAKIRAGQLSLMLSHLRNDQFDLWTREIGPLIERYFPGIARVAERAAQSFDRLLNTRIGDRHADILRRSIQTQSAAGFALDNARRSRELSRRVYRNADLLSGRVERSIRASIIQGDSAREIAKEVRQFINPSTPGGVSYAAMRLGRTELNNAFHERQVRGAENRPWVKKIIWNLSGSHPKQDICNVLAQAGPYLPQEVPDKPHPQCFCYMTYELISDDDAIRMALELSKAA